MKDISGIENVLEVLKPHWPEIEADFDKHNEQFLALSAANHDAIGRVLRVHLVIENFLDTFLSSHYGIEDLSDLRLTFAQKAKLLPSRGSNVSFVRPAILQINSVRNKFGHRLQHEISDHEVSAVYEVLSVARKGATFASHLEALEAFAPVACAFLSIPPKHLQELFLQAFSQVQVYNPESTQG